MKHTSTDLTARKVCRGGCEVSHTSPLLVLRHLGRSTLESGDCGLVVEGHRGTPHLETNSDITRILWAAKGELKPQMRKGGRTNTWGLSGAKLPIRPFV